jgi:type II secretion system protein H
MRADRADRRGGFTLVEVLAVLVVVALAAAVMLPRFPRTTGVRLQATAARLAARLSAARERAILGGHPVRVDPRDGLPTDVRIEVLQTPGAAAAPGALELAADGDPLPARIVLVDDTGARATVIVPPGFARPRVEEERG